MITKVKVTTIKVMRMTENRFKNTNEDKKRNHETKIIRISKTRQRAK
jgi:hypothetical protein